MAAYGNMEKGLPGLLFGTSTTHTIDSRLADGDVPFGAVVFGKGDGEQVSKTGDGAALGVACRTALDQPEYKDGDCVNVCRTGKLYVEAGEAISADSEISVNASEGKFIAKTSAADGAKRVVTVTVANASAEDKKATVTIGDQVFAVTTTADCKAAADVAAALKAEIAAGSTDFVATVSSAVITLTAKNKGVNTTAIVAATSDSTQTLTVAQTTAGSDQVVNPGWFARSTAEQAGDLLLLDLG